MLYKLNDSLKGKTTLKTNTLFNRSLPERLNQAFIDYLEKFNQDNDIKDLASEINWKLIIQIYKNECNELRSQFSIQEVIEGLNVKNLDVSLYALVIQTTVHSLFYHLYLILKDQIASNKPFESLDYNLTNNLSPIIKQYISSYYFQLELTRMTGNGKELIDATAVEKLKELANLGKAFSKGKSFDPKEIPVFKLIIQEYNKAWGKGFKKSYKTIAYYLGRTELDLTIKEEQHRFYKKFMAYKNSMQK